MDYAPFPLIDLSGSAHERGLQHGRAVPDRIERGIKMYADSLLKNGVDWPELERRAEALVPVIETFDAAYVEEMRGIAAGSGQPFSGGRISALTPAPSKSALYAPYRFSPPPPSEPPA